MQLPQNKEEFCRHLAEMNNPSILDMANDPSNLMAFKNNGGLFNKGVCWWHSRFQRNVLYLAIFRPDLQVPSQQRLREIIFKLRNGIEVVEIPGFSNFEEFSAANQILIQQELNRWQLFDGIILGKWIDGLKGSTQTSPEKLQASMHVLFNYVEGQKKIAYQKLQLKGITAHAWLVIGMRASDNGFHIGYIDSNMPRYSQNYTYQFGDKSFFINGYDYFVPYLEFTREESRLSVVAQSFCGKKQSLSSKSQQQYEADYRRDLEEAFSKN